MATGVGRFQHGDGDVSGPEAVDDEQWSRTWRCMEVVQLSFMSSWPTVLHSVAFEHA